MGAMMAWLHPGHIEGAFTESVLGLWAYETEQGRELPRFQSMMSGPGVAAARNGLVRDFLQDPTEPEWLWMLDSDMTFNVDALERLLEAADPEKAPVVGGLCFGGGLSGTVFPTLYRLVPVEGSPLPHSEHILDWPDGEVVKVDATGCACLLIHRTVLTEMARHIGGARPWFAEGQNHGRDISEDIMFCWRLNALDIPVMVHTGVKLGHMKRAVIDFEAFQQHRGMLASYDEDALKRDASRRLRRGQLSRPPAPEVWAQSAPTDVVIPVKDRLDLTSQLVEQLEDQGGYRTIRIFDNGSGPETVRWLRQADRDGRIVLARTPQLNIHQMWNMGIRRAIADGPANVAVLNNDLKLGDRFLERLAEVLRAHDELLVVCPNWDGRDIDGDHMPITGTAKAGGLSGWAWMVKGEAFGRTIPFIDEGHRWWFGDDDLVKNVQRATFKVGMVAGVSVEHIGGGSQSWDTQDEGLRQIVRADGGYHYAKWRST